ncbi:alpha/beta hydrolase fold domain-containing protein [Verrucomicrobia bacterium]|nr:alpha/beta hydrolase fold domain-containing protein [Verrucomicrobiota bacterium]
MESWTKEMDVSTAAKFIRETDKRMWRMLMKVGFNDYARFGKILGPMATVAKTIQRNKDGILNYWDHKRTTAFVKGINSQMAHQSDSSIAPFDEGLRYCTRSTSLLSLMHFPSITCIIILSLTVVANAQPEPKHLSLWPAKAPIGDKMFEDVDVPITVHLPAPDKATGTAVVICPGGGYRGLVTDSEGHGIAKWLNEHGIAGIVLEYRLPKQRPFVPILDARRAIRTVRAHAKEWGIKTDRIGIMGFSAGGHLAATAITHFAPGNSDAKNPINRESSRPDFGVLVYPVVSMGDTLGHAGCRTTLLGPDPESKIIQYFSLEHHVTKNTPPVYMAHAADDSVVDPANCRILHEALQARGISSKYLELPSGGHGLNHYKGPMWDAWQKGSLEWMKELHLLD